MYNIRVVVARGDAVAKAVNNATPRKRSARDGRPDPQVNLVRYSGCSVLFPPQAESSTFLRIDISELFIIPFHVTIYTPQALPSVELDRRLGAWPCSTAGIGWCRIV